MDSKRIIETVIFMCSAETRLLFVDKSSKAEMLIARRNKDFPNLSILVMLDKPEDSLIAKATELGMEVIEFKELEDLGRNVENPLDDQVSELFDLMK